jgi:rhamnopyranosyl-N-acetylglucosaminyl-diphospho-decaprenol beta-1,3/1,4-galactofuranosyltransferase
MNSVITFVLTRNRKELLRRCLTSILNQTLVPNKIIVLNNASTDDTSDMLKEFPSIVTEIYLQENIGGAAGFSYGIEICSKEDFDFIWVMDDDGYPKEDALQKLIEGFNELNNINVGVLNSIVIDPVSDEFTFGLWESHKNGRLNKLYNNFNELPSILEHNNFFFGWANLFNGTLIKNNIIKEIGLPDKRYFFRGDEVDYMQRIKKKFDVVTVLNSLHFHPTPLVIEPKGWRIYYYNRNDTINDIKYYKKSLVYVVKVLMKIFYNIYLYNKSKYLNKNDELNIKAKLSGLIDGVTLNLEKKHIEIEKKYPLD